MAKPNTELTVAQLEQLLNSRKSQLDTLLRKRAKLTNELEEIDKKIDQMDGGTAGRRRRNLNPRPRNPKSLHAVVLELLTRSKKGLTLSDLAEKVLKTGYKTHSTNFSNVLYQCLYNSENFFHDDKTATYKLGKDKTKLGKDKAKAKS